MSDIWKKRLLPASFRGIPFFVESHEFSGGRNVVPHELPDRDRTFAEDIGKKTPGFSLECHVLGDNYFFIRDGLISAMEDQDTGTLIHPYLGAKEVQPGPFSFREDTKDGRIARFTLTFFEAGEPSFPFALLDAVTDFITAAVVAVAQIKNFFLVAFKIAALPGFAVDSARALLDEFVSDLRNGLLNARLKPEEQAEVEAKLDEIEANNAALISNPASLAQEIDNVITLLQDVVADPPTRGTIDTGAGRDDRLDIFTDLLEFSAEEITATTPTRIQENTNNQALQNLINQLAAVRLSEKIVTKEFDTVADAVRQREIATTEFERQMQNTASDEVYSSFSELNAKLIESVPSATTGVAEATTIDLIQSTPSIILAYDLYESDELEQDILDRNKVRNPGFLIGEIEVISGA